MHFYYYYYYCYDYAAIINVSLPTWCEGKKKKKKM